jgi:hypothetical protein
VRELDHGVPARRAAELGEVDARDRAGAHAAELRPDAVGDAAHAQAHGRGHERQRRHQDGDGVPGAVEPGGVEHRRAPEEEGAELVGEAGRARVLHRPLTQARLDHRVVEAAGEAPLPAEAQRQGELERRQRQERPQPGRQRRDRHQGDEALHGAGGARVDDVEVPVRVGGAGGGHGVLRIIRYSGGLARRKPYPSLRRGPGRG